MEMQQRFRVNIDLMVGIQLIILVHICSCTHASSFLSEVDSCNSNSDSNNLNVTTLPHSENYVVKPYFEKYDSLLDLNFQEFIVNELSFGSCEAPPDFLKLVLRLSLLQRYLTGEGSHRRLSSSIKLDIQSEFISEPPTHSCEVIIIEKLPSGIFADPFELHHLLQRGVFTDVAVFGDTNLELPSIGSNRSLVEIHKDIGPSTLSNRENGLEINIELPLHARYPPLEESGYSIVEFGAPDLLMRCHIEGKSHTHGCLFMSNVDGDESRTNNVVWRIPSGIEAHSIVVSVITFVSALLSTALIVLTSICYSDVKYCKVLKQS